MTAPTQHLPVQHIGNGRAICDARKKAHLRTDLGEARYRQLGVKERFKDEKPYRVCERCINALDFFHTKRRLHAR